MYIGNESARAPVATDPLEWGSKLQNGQLVSITTEMPDGLLPVVRCNCKTDSSVP